MGQLVPKMPVFKSMSGYECIETSGSSGYKVLDAETLPPKCSYCGCWFKDIYRTCEHCGAQWEGK